MRQARPGAYLVGGDTQPEAAAPAFFGQPQVAASSSWDSLVPQPLLNTNGPFAAWTEAGGSHQAEAYVSDAASAFP
eukprot:2013373-Lingulodinium_polyedra.AAC.1